MRNLTGWAVVWKIGRQYVAIDQLHQFQIYDDRVQAAEACEDGQEVREVTIIYEGERG